jgi:hypothetical protein
LNQFTGYCYRKVSYKASYALRPFSDLLCVLVRFLIIPESYTRALWKIPAEAPSSDAGRNLSRMAVNFAGEVSLSYYAGIFNTPYNLTTWGRRLYFHSEGSRATDFYRHRPGMDPRTFGPMASTITTRPPRATSNLLSLNAPIHFTLLDLASQGSRCSSSVCALVEATRRRNFYALENVVGLLHIFLHTSVP